MAGSQRLKRMADSVQRELSELIRQELKDPRLGGYVTISAVKVSADMGYAELSMERQRMDVSKLDV